MARSTRHAKHRQRADTECGEDTTTPRTRHPPQRGTKWMDRGATARSAKKSRQNYAVVAFDSLAFVQPALLEIHQKSFLRFYTIGGIKNEEASRMQNMNAIDRITRLMLATVLLELAYFWLAGGWQIASYVAGAVLVATAAISVCPLYKLFGISTASTSKRDPGTVLVAGAALLLIGVVVGGSYASAFFRRKLFLEDFNAMNNYYKQTLFWTGKNTREKALANYDKLLPAYQQFQRKYTRYQPYALKGDAQLPLDMAQVAFIFADVNTRVRSGDLHLAHLDLEKARPVFQNMFKRNGFSMLAVALVDFHDAMELVLDAANQKDAAKLIACTRKSAIN
jgi:hypothetical protein